MFLTLFAASPAWCAWPHDPLVNLQVAPTATDQFNPAIVADGAGGSYTAFADLRAGNNDLYVQRVTSTGSIAPGWPASGLAVCTVAGDQITPAVVSDGSGGVIVAWSDARAGVSNHDIFVQRILSNGTVAPGWPVNGRQLSTNPKDELFPALLPDGAGGAFVAWTLFFGSPDDYDVYAGRVNSAGSPVWVQAIDAPFHTQDNPVLAADGSGGCIIGWEDNQTGDFDIKALRKNATGVTVYGPVTVCADPATQFKEAIAGDGAGGAMLAWMDSRSSVNYAVYANAITSTGAIAFGYSLNGNAVSSTTRNHDSIHIVTDGSAGAYIAWRDDRNSDKDIFMQHMIPAGAPAPGWPANGLGVCTVSGDQSLEDMASDNLGGAILVWGDRRSGVRYDLYAERVTTLGTAGPGWTAGGTVVSLAASFIGPPSRICSDAAGNATIAWADGRTQTNYNIYAQRMEVFGQLGNPEPVITKVRDVLADQGGRVRIDWSAGYLDANPAFGVGAYWIWRQAPAAQLALALRHGARLVEPAELDALASSSAESWAALARRGLYLKTDVGATTFAWEYLTSVGASALPTYSYVATTTTDSSATHNYYTPFMVQARATSGPAFWSSAPDSGYSVDNIPPAAPSPFLAAYSGAATHLHWGANTETDLAGYRLYRGSSSSFVPGSGNLVSAQPDTGYSDPGAAGRWYKLSAVDVNGNESAFAVLGPGGTTDAPMISLPTELALSRARPSPAVAATMLRFALPRSTEVRLAVFDAGGRLVRTVTRGAYAAGEHEVRWDLGDDGGRRVANGLYFVRFEAEGRTLVERVAVVH